VDKNQQLYIDEVMRFRKALNLTSINDPALFAERFVEPSLALGDWLPESGRLLDIGSGMGVPGIPLLIAHRGLHGVLVERRKKRAEFLRHVIRQLSLDAEVYDNDINALNSLRVDACVARAVTDQDELLNMCGRHTNPNAVAVLPVPNNSLPAKVQGWCLEAEQRLHGSSSEQLIRCYRFVDKG